jgi:hypothetical protein
VSFIKSFRLTLASVLLTVWIRTHELDPKGSAMTITIR